MQLVSVAMKWTVLNVFWTFVYIVSCEEYLSIPDPYQSTAQPNLDCAFDNGICGWFEASEESPLKWRRDRGSSKTRYSGPRDDHSPTGKDYYLIMETTYKYKSGEALLESQPIITPNGTCLSFWYMMYGFDVGSLSVSRIDLEGGGSRELFSLYGPQGNRWYHAVLDAGNGKFKLQIKATHDGKKSYGDIAIDDVTMSYKGECQKNDSDLSKDQPHFDCDFEDNLCSWYFMTGESMAWGRKTVPPHSTDRNAVPPFSSGTSYAELYRIQDRYYSSLRLHGPTISVDSNGACMTFWYRWDDRMVETFSVRKFNYGLGMYESGEVLWTPKEEYAPIWYRADVSVPPGEHFYIVFETKSNRNRNGRMNIDDISLSQNGTCPEEPLDSILNCDFEDGLCRWYMITKKNEDDWIRAKGPTPSNFTGPSGDHTTGDGYYLYLNAATVESARLISPDFKVTNEDGVCLHFWYYMYGEDVNTLRLFSFVEIPSGWHAYDIIWSMEHGQADMWIEQNVTIPYLPYRMEGVHLRFEAERSYFPRGDIAIDDISITSDGPCQSDIESEITPSTDEKANATESSLSSTTVATTFTTTTTTTTTTTRIPVPLPPSIVVTGKINPAYNNSHIELTCESNRSDELFIPSWYWRRNYGKTSEHLRSKVGRTIVFDEIHTTDAGMYSCRLQNFNIRVKSEMSTEVEIKVVPDPRPSPTLSVSGYSKSIEVGRTVAFQCGHYDVDGGIYLWKLPSAAFPDSSVFNNSRKIVLNDTSPKHSGTYSCRISKDGYLTAKSNEVHFDVRLGKKCSYSYECRGGAYKSKCKNNRCVCHAKAVIVGRECRLRPTNPKLSTYPRFLQFGIGESFYLICEVKDPVPLSLSYTFIGGSLGRSRKSEPGSLNIIKFENASKNDTGRYYCVTKYRNITSFDSESIYVEIKEFKNIDCDFAIDMCDWFQLGDSSSVNFTTKYSKTAERYIQLDNSGTTTSKAILRSPIIERTKLESCLMFWYRMQGPDAYSLTVWKFTSESGYNDMGEKLWTKVGDQGKKWKRKKITIPVGSNFYIGFEVIGEVAIDTILFTYRGKC